MTDMGVAFALLMLGHALGDFAFQSSAMVEGKAARRPEAFAKHILVIALMQAVTLLPVFPSMTNVMLVLGIALSHLLIDIVKTVISALVRRPFTWFLADQLAHVLVLFVVVRWVALSPCTLPRQDLGWVFGGAVLTATLVFNVVGGSVIVSILLGDLRRDDPAGGGEAAGTESTDISRGAGHWIGVLERLIVMAAVWQGEWAAVGLVLTAKSIARFKELEDRAFSEIYLVGTMTSVLVAIASGWVLRALL